ncbi:MAG: gamma-glutamyl-gamma-aminobutyrate hydrolase family protein [Candidatus Eremiobacteraeota bacterium]|nr:gamma-glutamyl-gamma-aminobutyrate hydrolase family protein [Candidatus Eremiobacteraeota bacterium]
MGPRIGVTSTNSKKAQECVEALKLAGAEPLVLENDESRAERDLEDLDAVLVSGGADIAPYYFGEELHPKTEATVPERDAYEMSLIKSAWRRDVPLLAICRGLQAMNVALGGSLIQHLPDVVDGAVDHQSGDTISERHVVSLNGESKLSEIVASQRFATNSTHHQALAKVADALRIVARTDDGIIEAVEAVPPRRFWIGVQWHPEQTFPKGDAPSAALFHAFIRAASR